MNSGPTLQAGSTGPDVRRLQRILVETKLLDFTHIDGSFAAATETAVKDFQEGNGLVSNGIVGPVTWAVLPADPMTRHFPVAAAVHPLSPRCKGPENLFQAKRSRRPGRDRRIVRTTHRGGGQSLSVGSLAALQWTPSSAIAPGGCRPERLARRSRPWPASPRYKVPISTPAPREGCPRPPGHPDPPREALI